MESYRRDSMATSKGLTHFSFSSSEPYLAARVRGYYQADATGIHKITLKMDNFCLVFISTDSYPKNVKAYRSPSPINWETIGIATFESGKHYYIEVLFINTGGPGNFHLRLQRPGKTKSEDLLSTFLTLEDKPQILWEPHGTILQQNHRLIDTLSCDVTGKLPIYVSWYKDGNLIKKSDTETFLDIENKTIAGGLYTCIVENSEGYEERNVLILDDHSSYFSFSTDYSSRIIYEVGDEIHFELSSSFLGTTKDQIVISESGTTPSHFGQLEGHEFSFSGNVKGSVDLFDVPSAHGSKEVRINATSIDPNKVPGIITRKYSIMSIDNKAPSLESYNVSLFSSIGKDIIWMASFKVKVFGVAYERTNIELNVVVDHWRKINGIPAYKHEECIKPRIVASAHADYRSAYHVSVQVEVGGGWEVKGPKNSREKTILHLYKLRRGNSAAVRIDICAPRKFMYFSKNSYVSGKVSAIYCDSEGCTTIRRETESLISWKFRSLMPIKKRNYAIYESCREALTVERQTTGAFWIKPYNRTWKKLECQKESTQFLNIVKHDLTGQTTVNGYEGRYSYKRFLKYVIPMSNLTDLIESSFSCRQYTRTTCRAAVLLWGSRGGLYNRDRKIMTYFGGGSPTLGGCACKIDRSCHIKSRSCNCDANILRVLSDSGYVKKKTDLPITGIALGDTAGGREWHRYSIGYLECIETGQKTDLSIGSGSSYQYQVAVDSKRDIITVCIFPRKFWWKSNCFWSRTLGATWIPISPVFFAIVGHSNATGSLFGFSEGEKRWIIMSSNGEIKEMTREDWQAHKMSTNFVSSVHLSVFGQGDPSICNIMLSSPASMKLNSSGVFVFYNHTTFKFQVAF